MANADRPWVIVGTGAMACLFGAHLAPHHPVCLLGTWKAGLKALQEGGIRVESPGGTSTVAVEASDDPLDCQGAQLALVLVKTWQTERAAAQLAACLADDGLAVSLQNGLGNLEILQAALGSDRASVGVTTAGATLLGPGHVRAGGQGSVHFGEDPRLAGLESALADTGVDVEISDDLNALVWGKLAVNAGINPLTALLGVPNGDLLERPAAQDVLAEAVREVVQVAQAKGIRLQMSDPVGVTLDVARRTASNRSSMLQDLERGAPTEIDAISGAISREGSRLGVPAPTNWALWKLVQARVEEE
jgi:2-dehydropantoate 2-reductase